MKQTATGILLSLLVITMPTTVHANILIDVVKLVAYIVTGTNPKDVRECRRNCEEEQNYINEELDPDRPHSEKARDYDQTKKYCRYVKC